MTYLQDRARRELLAPRDADIAEEAQRQSALERLAKAGRQHAEVEQRALLKQAATLLPRVAALLARQASSPTGPRASLDPTPQARRSSAAGYSHKSEVETW
jgi:hypothetical protein